LTCCEFAFSMTPEMHMNRAIQEVTGALGETRTLDSSGLTDGANVLSCTPTGATNYVFLSPAVAK